MGDIQFILPIQIGNNYYFQMTKTNREKTKENLKFVFTTDIGERVINSHIGSNFRKMLFENQNIDINKQIEDEINRIFNTYFPELILNNVKFKIQEQTKLTDSQILISLEYSFKNIEDSKDKLSLVIG